MDRWTCVLFPDGTKKNFRALSWESNAEFSGRLLCEIEQQITGERLGPTPKGTRWASWSHEGHYAGWMTSGLGTLTESTGEGPCNRTIRLPGLYSEREALVAFKENRHAS